MPTDNASVIGSQHGSTVNRPTQALIHALEDSADVSEHNGFENLSLEELAALERSIFADDIIPDDLSLIHI